MNTLDQLVDLSNELGRPENDCAILGEGNCSARCDDATFYVTASGASLRTATADDFVRVSFENAFALRDNESLDDDGVKQGLLDARVDGRGDIRPSTETAIHATCLSVPGAAINFVGHTHPTAINAITCSVAFEQALAGRLFPDEIVLLGVEPLLVPYVDPGMPLSREIHRRIIAYLDRVGEPPCIMLLQNHGLFAMGSTAQQVLDRTAMAVKTARILSGTYALGGPHFLSPENIARIHTRPDELYRQRVLGLL